MKLLQADEALRLVGMDMLGRILMMRKRSRIITEMTKRCSRNNKRTKTSEMKTVLFLVISVEYLPGKFETWWTAQAGDDG